MNTISESTAQWRPSAQLAVATQTQTMSGSNAPKEIPKVGDPDTSADGEENFKIFGDDGFTFLDFIDIINPLQHIPIVSTFYREMTDDTLDPGSRVLGGTLFFGPIGTVATLANVLVDDATGKDLGEHVMAMFEGEQPNQPPGQPEVSDAAPSQTALAGPLTAPASGEAVDPVTAWAIAEASYRQTAAGKTAPRTNPGPQTGQQQASLPETISVAEWARSEASYRQGISKTAPKSAAAPAAPANSAQIPGWTNASPYTTQPLQKPGQKPAQKPAQSPQHQAARGLDALSDLRKDLLAGAKPSTARPATRQARQRTATLAAASYARQQQAQAPIHAQNPAQARPSGAIAAQGGWFSETMLTALGKYGPDANLAQPAKVRNAH
ncbi:MAG: hypothetical protein H8E39_12390 [Alphaproteobacteria bacterium]|nr:hypothetical protein [Alphaproteobacteria bacterium]